MRFTTLLALGGIVRILRTASVVAALSTIVAGCGSGNSAPIYEMHGSTMGTRFSVQISSAGGDPGPDLAARISSALEEFEQRYSTWRPGSELSQFNDNRSTNWIDVSAELCLAVSNALELNRITKGAFDISIGRLVNLWGFGPDGDLRNRPPAAAIDAARNASGTQRVETDCKTPALRKASADIYLDLSAYAPGLAVDTVAAIVESSGYRNYVVDIGGEVRANGVKGNGECWSIAIESPDPAYRLVRRILPIENKAVATSGDYRNFVDIDGRRYSHLIDPRNGEPISGALASVTVVADSAAVADAMATALMVLGPKEGFALALDLKVAAYFIVRDTAELVDLATPEFDAISKTAVSDRQRTVQPGQPPGCRASP